MPGSARSAHAEAEDPAAPRVDRPSQADSPSLDSIASYALKEK
jgi:hypothetical protein